MRDCFVSVGLAPFKGTGTTSEFRKYTNHRRGSMAINKADVDEDTTCLGEVAAELQMVHDS